MKKPVVLITSGPTREYIDPIRFISNRSSGLMGLFLAKEIKKNGFNVLLISGPTSLKYKGIKKIDVETTEEMFIQAKKHFNECDIFISAAAACDYRPNKIYSQKIKKPLAYPLRGGFTLQLIPATDILLELSKIKRENQILIGFAVETENLIKNAKKKLEEKKLDLIFANPKENIGSIYGEGYVISKTGKIKKIKKTRKEILAKKIWNEIKKIYYEKRRNF